MDLLDLIDNLFTKKAFPAPRMPAIVNEFFEDHGTAAARTIHRALTIHMNLLNPWITLIQTNRCHDFMIGMLNFYEGEMTTVSRISQPCQLSVTLDNLILDLTGNRMEKMLPLRGSL